jgi:hypothetical protein
MEGGKALDEDSFFLEGILRVASEKKRRLKKRDRQWLCDAFLFRASLVCARAVFLVPSPDEVSLFQG